MSAIRYRLSALAVAVVVASTATPSARASVITDSLIRDRLIGAWADMGDCHEGALTFNDDGTFTLTGPHPEGTLTGTFDVKDGRLAGHAGDRVMPVFPIFFDDETLVLGPDRLDRCKADVKQN